jgi:hypothetical protein
VLRNGQALQTVKQRLGIEVANGAYPNAWFQNWVKIFAKMHAFKLATVGLAKTLAAVNPAAAAALAQLKKAVGRRAEKRQFCPHGIDLAYRH